LKTFLLILLSLNLSAQADKRLHALAGISIAGVTYALTEDKEQAPNNAYLTVLISGPAKETYDFMRGGPFSISDVMATWIPGIITAALIKIVHNFRQRNKGDFSAFDNLTQEPIFK
jgi:hypothetical protein